jgi:uncharacterized protein with gpF-like domain
MELPDDVLRLVSAYAKPTEQIKIYTRTFRILKYRLSLDLREKLKTAIRFHFETFQQVFLELEKRHAELVVAVDAYMSSRGPGASEAQMEYYLKRQNYTFTECAVMNLIREL